MLRCILFVIPITNAQYQVENVIGNLKLKIIDDVIQ